ncbi:LysR family transcriptional regulator [Clostridium sp. DJ247]|uniref:LysR family transcriptional regulator n=1 Tax=Clostridium sp. DJ247 TaxID=2726188 RepID=UPI00162A2F90|nr:LysR family transcriptional regulator [Clostridium sp. DJ247]MBC2582294.1 LysR family transcriptional regulator [Clostridium sp. DJ247]
MEFKHLKSFVVVAETLSFSRTAEILNFAQSSISDQIRFLENELGCKLFERLGKNIYLTKEGNKLLSYVLISTLFYPTFFKLFYPAKF